jgi:hypothetical protein
MKKGIIQLVLLALLYTETTAQQPASCPPNPNTPTTTYCKDGKGISTDPDNLINTECPNLKNDFEWRLKNNTPPGSAAPDESYVTYDGNRKYEILNPFSNTEVTLDYAYLSAGQNGNNYQPEDGWELLKADFGMQSNIGLPYSSDPGRNTTVGTPKLPYFILYNKYTGTLRFFGTLVDSKQDYGTIRVELRIPSESPDADNTGNLYFSDLAATNLLSIQGDAIQPLDQETEETSLSVFVKSTNDEERFFWFDIPVAYDPCLCRIRSQLDVTFRFLSTASIALNGNINDGIKTDTKPDNTPYALKVTTKVVAAALSTAVAIKSGGTIINVKAYTDLINVIRNNPNSNLSSQQLDDLAELENNLKCGDKFIKTISGNLKDLKSTDEKKAVLAALKIVEGGTTFFSSAVTGGCEKKDNSGTGITANAAFSGTFTEEVDIPSTIINLAMPGSDWSDKTLSIIDGTDDPDPTVIPAYPTYNERLGTFALLETPKIQLYGRHLEDVFPGRQRNIYRISEASELKYTFNPLLNVNEEETKIQFRYVVKQDLDVHPDPVSFRGSTFINQHLYQNEEQEYPLASPFLPIEYYDDFHPFIFILEEWPYLQGDSIFIQLKIAMTSNDIGRDGPNQAFYFLTYPVSVEFIELGDIPLPGVINEQTMQQHAQEQAWRNLQISTMFQSSSSELQSGGKVYSQDIMFNEDKIIAFDGVVEVSAKLSTASGKKVTIYSSVGFELLPGAEISPDIELIIGYPFESNPIPPQTFDQVNDFCQDNNKYKAQTFAAPALLEERRTYEERYKAEQERIAKLKAKPLSIGLYPNPTRDEFTLDFEYALEGVSVSVSDLNGKVISTQLFNGNHKQIQMNATYLKAGVYFVEIRTLSGKLGRERLVKY